MISQERRYREDEIKAIFKEAAEAQENAKEKSANPDGLTLTELQEIGREAGITPEFIARASDNLNRTPLLAGSDRFLGLPIRVSKSVDLPGPLSENGWEVLVSALRETFQAHGQVRRHGSLREWKNGNLHAVIEPTESGHRLRMYTKKGNASAGVVGGLSILAFGIVLLLSVVLAGQVNIAALLAVAMVCALGLGTAGATAVGLPAWQRQRGLQMDAMAARAVELAERDNRQSMSGAKMPLQAEPEARLDLPEAEEEHLFEKQEVRARER